VAERVHDLEREADVRADRSALTWRVGQFEEPAREIGHRIAEVEQIVPERPRLEGHARRGATNRRVGMEVVQARRVQGERLARGAAAAKAPFAPPRLERGVLRADVVGHAHPVASRQALEPAHEPGLEPGQDPVEHLGADHRYPVASRGGVEAGEEALERGLV
jgi:hypothetical protein